MLVKQLSISEDENGSRTVKYVEFNDVGTQTTRQEKEIDNDKVTLQSRYNDLVKHVVKPTVPATKPVATPPVASKPVAPVPPEV